MIIHKPIPRRVTAYTNSGQPVNSVVTRPFSLSDKTSVEQSNLHEEKQSMSYVPFSGMPHPVQQDTNEVEFGVEPSVDTTDRMDESYVPFSGMEIQTSSVMEVEKKVDIINYNGIRITTDRLITNHRQMKAHLNDCLYTVQAVEKKYNQFTQCETYFTPEQKEEFYLYTKYINCFKTFVGFLKNVSLRDSLPLATHKDDTYIKQNVRYDSIYGYFLKYKASNRVASMMVDTRSKITHYRKAVIRSLCRIAAIFPWIQYSVSCMDLQWSRILYNLIGKYHKCCTSSSSPPAVSGDKFGLCCTYTIAKLPMSEVYQIRQRLLNLMIDLIMNLVFLESSYYFTHLSETQM